MSNRPAKPVVPLVLLFIVLNGIFLAGKSRLEAWGFNANVLIIGHLVLFLVTIASFFLAMKGLRSTNPHAFMRSVYSSIIIKLFLCMIAAFIYIATYKKDLNKQALFTLMGLYLVYTFVEVSALTKQLRLKTNE